MTTKNRKRSLPAFVALIGVLLMSSGFAIMATAGSASATQDQTECVPKDAYYEYSGWVTESPGEGWVKYKERVVTDKEAWTEKVLVTPEVPGSPGFWTNFQPNNIHEPFVGPPSYPTDSRGTWSDPKTDGGPQQNASGVYQNGQGHGSWFYREQPKAGTPAVYKYVDHDAETHVEYKYKLKHAAVECPPVEPPVDVCPNIEGPQATIPDGFVKDEAGNCVEPPAEVCPDGSAVVEGELCEEVSPPLGEDPPAAAPPVNNPPAKSPTKTSTTTSTVAGPSTSTPSSTVAGPTIPSTVKAGLGEDVAELAATRTSQGLALVGAGALVMLAGGLGMVRRRGVFARI